MPNPLDYPFWLASRSAGVVAYVLLSASVVLGLAMATRLAPARDLRVSHERVALLALGAVAAHGLLLIPDRYLRPGLSELLIPSTTGYRPLWTGLRVLAAYGAAGLSLTYYCGAASATAAGGPRIASSRSRGRSRPHT